MARRKPNRHPDDPFIETTLSGRDGEVGYVTTPLGFGQAYRLGLQLAGVLAPVLGAGAAALFGLDGTEDGEEGKAAPPDFRQATEELGQLPQHLLDLGGEKLIMRIFARTVRVHGGQKQQLKAEQGLTDAYAGGNFGEMFRAVWWVLRVNFGPFGMDESSDWSELWSKLQAMLRSDSSTDSTPSSSETPDSDSEPDEDA